MVCLVHREACSASVIAPKLSHSDTGYDPRFLSDHSVRIERRKNRKTRKNHRRDVTAACVPAEEWGERKRAAREEGRERVSERERGTMSYPNEHVASKTLSSCSVPRNPPNHVDYVVRRSRRTDPRRACAALRSCRCKVEQSRAITRPRGDDEMVPT